VMTESVSLPLWLVITGVALAFWSFLHLVILPSIRWFFRRRTKKVINKVDERLDLRLPDFKLTKRREIIDRLVFDSKVQEAVKIYAEEQDVSHAAALKKVKKYAHEIVPSFNALIYFRFGNWVSRNVCRMLYRVRVGFVDEEGFSKVDPSSSVVFIINHRSNIDYILLGYLTISRVALSFAVGEWARVWPLQQLLRALGGFFVRRGSGNTLYRRVLERYIQMATEGGVVQAVFPEGKLSKDGRLGRPKIGILDYMLRTFDPEKGRDLIFIPVGINYDRVLEDRSSLAAVDPKAHKKKKTDVLKTISLFLLKTIRLRLRRGWYRYGYAVVNFGSPISMKMYAEEHNLNFSMLKKEQRIQKVEMLSQDLMTAVGKVIPVVPVALIASIFLEDPDKSFSELELKTRVQHKIDNLEECCAVVYIPRSDHAYAIEVGLRMLILRHIVLEENDLYRAAPGEIKILQYYANSIAHLFKA
jgi:glycerol-3-phosphate O-acyltransferase